MASERFTRRAAVRRRAGGSEQGAPDPVAVEEPLEIRIAGEPVAVTMRTPGDDVRLAAGFLFSEGLIASAEDLGTLSHCGHPGEDGYGNVIEVTPASGAVIDAERLEGSRRGAPTSSACGVCGRKTVEDLTALCGALKVDPGSLSAALLARSPERLAEIQTLFGHTGGTHAAAILDRDGRLLAAHEDVGRHNAVDKAIGALLIAGLVRRPRAPPHPGAPALLVVSGRASFEIVQKAAVAGIPVVAAVSAASSLAIDLAARCGITLAAFVRGGSYNLYTHSSRIGA